MQNAIDTRRVLRCITLTSVVVVLSIVIAGAEDWPQFRGPARDGISRETGLLRQWPAGGPKVLWTVPVGQGYAGAAILGGRVYHNDYDEKKNEWGVYARSLADGKEIWHYKESRVIRQPRDQPHRSRRLRQVRLLARSEAGPALPGREDRKAALGP